MNYVNHFISIYNLFKYYHPVIAYTKVLRLAGRIRLLSLSSPEYTYLSFAIKHGLSIVDIHIYLWWWSRDEAFCLKSSRIEMCMKRPSAIGSESFHHTDSFSTYPSLGPFQGFHIYLKLVSDLKQLRKNQWPEVIVVTNTILFMRTSTGIYLILKDCLQQSLDTSTF